MDDVVSARDLMPHSVMLAPGRVLNSTTPLTAHSGSTAVNRAQFPVQLPIWEPVELPRCRVNTRGSAIFDLVQMTLMQPVLYNLTRILTLVRIVYR